MVSILVQAHNQSRTEIRGRTSLEASHSSVCSPSVANETFVNSWLHEFLNNIFKKGNWTEKSGIKQRKGGITKVKNEVNKISSQLGIKFIKICKVNANSQNWDNFCVFGGFDGPARGSQSELVCGLTTEWTDVAITVCSVVNISLLGSLFTLPTSVAEVTLQQ